MASGYGLSVDSPIPGVNRFRVYWPGDGAAIVAANLRRWNVVDHYGAGGTDVVFSLARDGT